RMNLLVGEMGKAGVLAAAGRASDRLDTRVFSSCSSSRPYSPPKAASAGVSFPLRVRYIVFTESFGNHTVFTAKQKSGPLMVSRESEEGRKWGPRPVAQTID